MLICAHCGKILYIEDQDHDDKNMFNFIKKDKKLLIDAYDPCFELCSDCENKDITLKKLTEYMNLLVDWYYNHSKGTCKGCAVAGISTEICKDCQYKPSKKKIKEMLFTSSNCLVNKYKAAIIAKEIKNDKRTIDLIRRFK